MMIYRIDNQILEIENGKTIIKIEKLYGTMPFFVEKLDFDFNDFPKYKEHIKNTNIALFYWLSNLYNDWKNLKHQSQLELF